MKHFNIPIWPLFLVALLLLLVGAGMKGWRITQAAQSLLGRQAEVENLLANGLTNIDPETAESLVLGVREDIVTLKTETALFMPWMPYLGWLPKVGSTLVVSPHLMEMADAGTATAVYAFRGLQPALALLQNDASSDSRIPALVNTLDAAEPDLIQANLSFARLMAARQALGDPTDLHWRVRDLLAQVDPLLPVAQDGLKFALVLPEMMGSDGPRRYLLIAQNEDELRPTGGFITGAGVITVENGRILDLSFEDANFVDDWQHKPYGDPPQPYRDFMQLDLFFFRDANFWPDFPTSAETAMNLYSYGRDVPLLDGAIAFDQQFLQLLLQATGPIPIPDTTVTMDSQNVITTLRTAWGPEGGVYEIDWVFDRKAFLSTFAGAIRTRIETDFGSMNPLSFAQSMVQALQSKHLQLYMHDSAVAAVLDELDWDGRLPASSTQDFLMVADANMGYNKVNLFIQREITYHVTLEDTPQAHLIVTYDNHAPDNGEPCSQSVPYDEDPTYLDIAERCYFNYLRVYTPFGSELVQSSQHIVPGETLHSGQTWQKTAETVPDLTGFTTFANFLLVPFAETETADFTYQLPTSVIQSSNGQQIYKLWLSKQAGTPAQNWHITITLPANALLTTTSPSPTAVAGDNLVYKLNLDSDVLIQIIYQ